MGAPEKWEAIDIPTHPIANGCWVRAAARIRKNATGEVRSYEQEQVLRNGNEWPDTYIWEDGNYSCDCNRELFYEYAIGRESEDIETECGDGCFSVQLYNPVTGTVYYDEFERESGGDQQPETKGEVE